MIFNNKNILIFYPYNKIAVDQISVIELLSKKYNIIFLSIESSGPINLLIKQMGVQTYSIRDEFNKKNFYIRSNFIFYFYMLFFFRKLFLKHKIELVFSHLEIPGLISGIFSFFYKFKNFYFRHNMDAMSLDSNLKGKVINRLVNYISSNIVCVSEAVENYLIKIEKVNPKKIKLIRYGYNFEKYFDYQYENKIKEIKNEYSADILLISVGRLVPLKRHYISLQLIKKLNLNSPLKYKLIVLGDGPEKNNLLQYCKNNNLNNVFFLGFRNNIIDYIKASDLMLHFSKSESFGHVVMESGLSSTPALACKNTGIFEKFIQNKKNGFLVNKEDPLNESFELLMSVKKNQLEEMGLKLNLNVLNMFDIKNVIHKYYELIEN